MNNFPGIRIGGYSSYSFENDVVESLNRIQSGPSGRRLLQKISEESTNEKHVTISEANAGQAPVARPRLTLSQMSKLGSNPTQREFESMLIKESTSSSFINKKGTASEIPWSKMAAEPEVNSSGVPIAGANPDNAFIALAHELIHANHHLAGTSKYGGSVTRDASSALTKSGKEELRAVGLGKYEFERTGKPTENSIRREHGLPLRTKYSRSGEW
ncbi:NleD-like pathogen effector protein (putative zinc metallopeptidase)|uniref:NleD-like pathogen effector protein (Putative zinc metallopeptidase) n=1 Tax=Brenneria salicis ATCC 15712 = DSM 30166 TaxID=714314 RepID=A0A366IAQ4_9GAMM|nr:XopG/HopH/AvrPtoH family type III secretion system effector [Brenneria salicis]NMN91691.1 NleD-like pathogen effector protein (putative zinc metallopeptidase) [Brenneria salicis ATCC 15712 = DSM 30166]RBP65749.1 NleD-like pathogen effector protein (putative zinc metallopeptidase) [Brenneria salicis ATCC 15712 = DSM 30166]